ncbi:HAD family hydrolase [Halapricum desulfuricans]|uniref:HAD superfamily hydrolase n=1 Tax=Halapricum desulfuricans TaxID=2841257 RepID=A0A897N3S2_9EURY|nr:HAD family phosphatase [Halapricum desulfuricans]QSG07284.1 HAD superfamily hydrolase [Halapricum desulfuricans]
MPAVLFDMDGVVIDSERYWPDLESERLFPEVVPDQDVDPAEVMGMNYREIYDYLAQHYEVAVDRDRHVELFDELAREIYGERASLMDGFDDLLADLQARGIAVGLVTSSPPAWIDVVLERFGLTGRFDAVVSAENVPNGKPEPDVYRRALRELDAKPGAAVAVEDSTTGARAATAAGIRCLGYTGVHDGIDPEAVDAVVSDPEQLRAALFEGVE